MAQVIKEFNEYRIRYYTPNSSNKLTAYIFCFMNGSYRGSIEFHRTNTQLGTNYLSKNSITLHYYDDVLPGIIDLLRNEKPLYLSLNDQTLVGWVDTSEEIVGEEES